jgi:hypothetical protein
MNLYEVYEICRGKPIINRDDKPSGSLTVSLPDLDWREFESPLLDEWREAEERAEWFRKNGGDKKPK